MTRHGPPGKAGLRPRGMRALLAAATLPWLVSAAVSGAFAARMYQWKDAQGVTHYGDRPPGADPGAGLGTEASAGTDSGRAARVTPLHTAPGAMVKLRLQDQGTRYLAWADNTLQGPVEVQLDFTRGRNAVATPSLPARAVVLAHGSTLVATLDPRDPLAPMEFALKMDAVPGSPLAHPRDFAYRVPFDYGRVAVDQGFGGRFSHDDPQNLYAVDFAVDVGTPILAARDGVVMEVESDFDKAGLNREKFGGRANFIRILHDDGSMALYAHLQWDGVLVRAGQRVRSGQRIGLSGNTGFTTGPHLHFVVQANRGMRLESVPFRMFGAQGELKFPRGD